MRTAFCWTVNCIAGSVLELGGRVDERPHIGGGLLVDQLLKQKDVCQAQRVQHQPDTLVARSVPVG